MHGASQSAPGQSDDRPVPVETQGIAELAPDQQTRRLDRRADLQPGVGVKEISLTAQATGSRGSNERPVSADRNRPAEKGVHARIAWLKAKTLRAVGLKQVSRAPVAVFILGAGDHEVSRDAYGGPELATGGWADRQPLRFSARCQVEKINGTRRGHAPNGRVLGPDHHEVPTDRHGITKVHVGHRITGRELIHLAPKNGVRGRSARKQQCQGNRKSHGKLRA